MRKLQQELEKKKKRLQQQQGKKRKRLEAKEEKRKAKKLREDLLITNSAREYSDPIPADLLVDIFSRVPAKSIGRFRCVSKFWKSILRRPDFKELFLTKSVAIPRLFFVVQVNKEFCVFSSPQRQSPDDNSSLVATRYKNFPLYFPTGIFTLLCGLVFLQDWETKAQVICNPATGESITLPKVKATRTEYSYFGFDPISKQFKVLCMTRSRYGTPNTHQVLTLGTGKRKWRTVHGPLVPHGTSSGICIDGVLYYEAYGKIVCFDFRFEKFSLINMDKDMWHGFRLTLFNYKGTLGAHKILGQGDREKIVLWVLEDAEKHKWSKRILVLPDRVNSYHFVGMTGTGEIVFTPYHLSKHSHILYYNMERKTFTRINIQGFEEFNDIPIILTYLDYVERMKFM